MAILEQRVLNHLNSLIVPPEFGGFTDLEIGTDYLFLSRDQSSIILGTLIQRRSNTHNGNPLIGENGLSKVIEVDLKTGIQFEHGSMPIERSRYLVREMIKDVAMVVGYKTSSLS